MKNVFLLLLISLLTIQCNNSKQTNSNDTQEKINENKVIGELIGTKLVSVQETKEELDLMFDFEIIDSYLLDIDNDGLEDEIIIEKIKDWNDPGDFHRIRIINQTKEYEYFNGHGWINISDFELQFEEYLKEDSQVDSKYIIISNASNNDKLLFCFGYVYASQPGLLSIINLSGTNTPELIYNDNTLLYGFKDLDNDKSKDIQVTKFDKEEIIGKENSFKTYNLIDGWLHIATN